MAEVHGEVLDVGGEHRVGQKRLAGRPTWTRVALAVLTGAVLGAAATHAWDARQTPANGWMTGRDVRVSLGAGTSERLCMRAGDTMLVPVSTAVVNRSGTPLTLTAISVNGLGAGYVDSPPGGPSTGLPRSLPPGQVVDVRFGLTSDPRVVVRPLPSVRFTVEDAQGRTRALPVEIPDLDAIWGMTLLPKTCGTS